MAARRVYGGSNMAALLQSEGIPPETIQALLSPGSSPGGFIVSRNMVNFEDVCGNTSERPSFYRPPFDLEDNIEEELDESLHQPEKKRRLTTDQVRFLEKSFELENKLEPERKIQLARDLGLQPRQVAIWFQNRRARWKTKQLEKDYEALKINFNALKTDHDNLLKEKEKLKAEIVSLTEKVMHKEKDKLDDNDNKHTSPEFKNSINNELIVETRRSDDVQEPVLVCKQEDLSSTNSAVFDSESSHYTDEVGHADSSNAFEPDHSDLSHADEGEEVKKYPFLKFEDSSTDYGVVVEDQPFWFWNY